MGIYIIIELREMKKITHVIGISRYCDPSI